MSLQNTCMHCHSNKQKFCDECHTYVAVKPYCWDCHIAPKAADPYLKPVMVSGFPVSAKFLFEVGKAALPADADKASVAVIDYLKKDAAAKAVISGYTDQTGDAAKNAELAKARAFAVRDLLTKAGIAEGRIIMKKPELITGTGDNAQARRVEVNVVTGKGV
jgi:cytochrome c oxidase subunit 2